MTEEYEMSVYDRHELNYDHIALGRLPAVQRSMQWLKQAQF